MSLVEEVGEYLRSQSLLEPDQQLVIGVSGGPDSLCLLDCLHKLGYRPVVAHLDHALRENSQEDARFVAQTARDYGLPLMQATAAVTRSAGSLEEAGRIVRYRFLAECAAEHQLSHIAVGHTADDQAETVLMHLLRGAGSAGLGGMLPSLRIDRWAAIDHSDPLWLVRPLLGVSRQQVLSHCDAVGLRPRTDPSNSDLAIFRNRLRHEVIPYLQRYNPAIKDVLTRTAKVMAAEAELVAELVEAQWQNWIRKVGDSAYAIQPARLLSAPLALQRATIRRLILHLRPSLRDIGFEAVEGILLDLQASEHRRRSIVGGLELLPLSDEVVVRKPGSRIAFPDRPQLQASRSYSLSIPGMQQLADGWRIEVQESTDLDCNAGASAIFDAEKLSGALFVRPPRTGDRLQPLGMNGTVKLSDLFINRKIPQPARERWPVVADQQKVVWVPGLHVSRLAACRPDTARVIRFRLLEPGQ